MSIKWKQENMIKHNEYKQYRPSSPIFHHRNQPTSILSSYPTNNSEKFRRVARILVIQLELRQEVYEGWIRCYHGLTTMRVQAVLTSLAYELAVFQFLVEEYIYICMVKRNRQRD